MKSSLLSSRSRYDVNEIIIVDPENEYSIIGQAFGGESIDIAPDSTTFLNVLDLSDGNNSGWGSG